jgi:hypothetical protein
MDPSEIIKAAPEIAKGVTEVGAAFSLTPIIKAFFGDAAGELGKRFGDRVRLYRYGRSLEMLKKAEKMAQDAGFTPRAVPIKLLFPLLEGASFEENEDLHTMWSSLLANAGSSEYCDKVRPGFIGILKLLSTDEAVFLKLAASNDQWLREYYADVQAAQGNEERLTELNKNLIPKMSLKPEFFQVLRKPEDENHFRLCYQILEAQGLVNWQNPGPMLTVLGHAFLDACSAPAALKGT